MSWHQPSDHKHYFHLLIEEAIQLLIGFLIGKITRNSVVELPKAPKVPNRPLIYHIEKKLPDVVIFQISNSNPSEDFC